MPPLMVPRAVVASPSEQRISERFDVGLPCTIEGRQSHTSDLSANGIAFESNTCHAVGEVVRMTVHYGLDGHNVLLPCEVEVMRVEPHDDHFKIGARLLRPFFEPEE